MVKQDGIVANVKGMGRKADVRRIGRWQRYAEQVDSGAQMLSYTGTNDG